MKRSRLSSALLFLSALVLVFLFRAPAYASVPSSGINSSGEHFGSAVFANEDLDLIAAIGNDGTEGYIRSSDLYQSDVQSPAQALIASSEPASLPLYDSEGRTVIGTYPLTPIRETLVSSLNVVPYGTAYSGYKTFSVNGISYQNRASVSTYSNLGSVQSRVYIGRVSGTAAAGHLGYNCNLYNSEGRFITSSGFKFNGAATAGIEGYMDYSARSGSFYAMGSTKVWNSSTSSYSGLYYTYQSPSQSL